MGQAQHVKYDVRPSPSALTSSLIRWEFATTNEWPLQDVEYMLHPLWMNIRILAQRLFANPSMRISVVDLKIFAKSVSSEIVLTDMKNMQKYGCDIARCLGSQMFTTSVGVCLCCQDIEVISVACRQKSEPFH